MILNYEEYFVIATIHVCIFIISFVNLDIKFRIYDKPQRFSSLPRVLFIYSLVYLVNLK